MQRRLKLMADYGCSPLWEYSDDPANTLYANHRPSDLPLSKPTVDDLNAWAAWFDSFLDFDDPAASREVSAEEAAAFDGEGRRLWVALQAELGEGWIVCYFEEGRLLEP